MKRRILFSHLAISLLTIILFTLLVRMSAELGARRLVLDALGREAALITRHLEDAEDDHAVLEQVITTSRITLINPDGTVVFDTDADASQQENHADRPEIAGALEDGRASSVRWSATLGEHLMYYAQRLPRGQVLRLSDAVRTTSTVFTTMLPWLLLGAALIVLAAALLSRRVTRVLLKPLEHIDLTAPAATPVYEELTPLLSRIMEQNIESAMQIAKLNEKQHEMDTLLDGMSEGFLAMDRHHRVLRLNHSAGEMLGVKLDDAVGKTLPEINRRPEILRMLTELDISGTATTTMLLNGRTCQLTANAVGSDRGAVVLLRDMTERIEGETARKRFTANVSHELRTPLTTICGYAEMLSSGMVREEDRPAFLMRITTESRRMLALVEDILRLSKLDEGYPGGRREPVNLWDIAMQAITSLEAAAQAKDVKVQLTGEAQFVMGDPTLLSELVFNLLDNAIKYNKPAGAVDIALAGNDNNVTLKVKDTGIGIAPEHQDKIFERFYRTDKSRSKETGGTGLGLSIVKHSAEYHGAKLSVESTPGEGTTISVMFPKG